MRKHVLIIYGGRFEQSHKIANEFERLLAEADMEPFVVSLTKNMEADLWKYDAFILVTSVRYGYFDKNAYRYIAQNMNKLTNMPCLAVTVSLTARKPEKRDPKTHSYTAKFLEKSGWPGDVEVVAGELNYPKYKIWDRLAIQLIMKMTGGPTDKTTVIEYTDWDQIDRTSDRFIKAINS